MTKEHIDSIINLIDKCPVDEGLIYAQEKKAFNHLLKDLSHPQFEIDSKKFYHLLQVKKLLFRLFDDLKFEWEIELLKKDSLFKYFDDLYWRIPELEGKTKSRFISNEVSNLYSKGASHADISKKTTFEHLITRNFVRNYIVNSLTKNNIPEVVEDIFFINKCVLVTNEEDKKLCNQLILDDNEYLWDNVEKADRKNYTDIIDFGSSTWGKYNFIEITNCDFKVLGPILYEKFEEDLFQRYEGCNIVIEDRCFRIKYDLNVSNEREELTKVLLNHISVKKVLGTDIDNL